MPEIPIDEPVYINALALCTEDNSDTSGGSVTEVIPTDGDQSRDGEEFDQTEQDSTEDRENEPGYVNPYLKPPVKLISPTT